MKILINAISAKAGGIVTYTSNLIAALEARGADFVVAVPETFPDTPHTMRVRASNYPPLRRLAWEQSVWRAVVHRKKPHVLFSSANFGLLGSPVPQMLMVREGGLFDPLYMATIAPDQGLRPAIQRYLRRRLMLTSAQANDHIITPTRAMRDMLLDWAPDLAGRCSVNPYGTLVDTFQPANRRPWRADGTLRTLYVSVYYPHKNPADQVLACEKLRAEGIEATMRLTMDRDHMASIRGSARDLYHVDCGVAAGFLTLGRVGYDQLPAMYAEHDVFVFPSVSETFGHPMIEALASGIPVVAADVPVNREVLGDAALYFTPFRHSELAAQLRRLDADPALRQRLTEAGRLRATASFDWNDHVSRLLDLFEQLATTGRVRPA
jgi:glycosyltransferase involved in cell wall biosynthesis